jgi:peptidoglycan hydrolase-like protein with peptidoglycan-binding domain
MKAPVYQSSAPTTKTFSGASSALIQNQRGLLSKFDLKKLSGTAGILLLSVALNLTVFSGVALAQLLQRGNSGYEVENLQYQLNAIGYFNGPFTGYYGELTEEAIKRFQRDNGLVADGIYGSRTAQALSSYSGVGYGPGDEDDFPGSTPSSARYVVVVPVRGSNTYSRVLSVVGRNNAVVRDSRLGDYVQAGAFSTYNSAESRVRQLRQAGLDARVDYR